MTFTIHRYLLITKQDLFLRFIINYINLFSDLVAEEQVDILAQDICMAYKYKLIDFRIYINQRYLTEMH